MVADRLGEVGACEDASEVTQVRKHPVGQLCWQIYRVALSRLDMQFASGLKNRVGRSVPSYYVHMGQVYLTTGIRARAFNLSEVGSEKRRLLGA